MKEKIKYVIETLKTEKEDIEEMSNGDWILLAQAVGLQRGIELLEEIIKGGD